MVGEQFDVVGDEEGPMADHATTLDLTMMYAVHDALRRDAAQLARISRQTGDDPRRRLRSAVGWELFTRFLHVHHTTEDVTIWPVMRGTLADRPDDLALLDAMESEHARLDSLITQVDAALADADHGHERLGDLVDALVTELSAHLRHEEKEGLPLIDAVLTPQQWQRFGEEHRRRVGSDASHYLPWLLEGADPQYAVTILSRIPAQFQQAYHAEWRAAFAGLDRWGAAA